MYLLSFCSIVLYSFIVSFLFKELPLGCGMGRQGKGQVWGGITNTKDCWKSITKSTIIDAS